MDFSNFVGKEIIIDGKKGFVKRRDKQREDIYIVKVDGENLGIDVKEYDFYEKDNIIVMELKPGPDYWPVPSKDSRIYHSTSFQNALMIIRRQGMLSRWQLLQMGVDFHNTADPSIIDWRKNLGIENMIPFHFKSKTPYEYAVFTDNKVVKRHKTVPTEDMVVITINKHKYDFCSYVFTAHPLSGNAVKFHANNAIVPDLKFWTTLDKYKGYSPMSDGADKQICMAEYDVGLSYIPLDDILEIYVQTQEKADILLAEDKGDILKDKIIVGDKRYLR